MLSCQGKGVGVASFQMDGIPSRELTYPTLGKGKIIFKMPFLGNMLVPWMEYDGMLNLFRWCLKQASEVKLLPNEHIPEAMDKNPTCLEPA